MLLRGPRDPMSSKRAMPRLVEVTLWMERHSWLFPLIHCARAHRAFSRRILVGATAELVSSRRLVTAADRKH